jgi:tetratricopeptide (TPR) repeat protein
LLFVLGAVLLPITVPVEPLQTNLALNMVALRVLKVYLAAPLKPSDTRISFEGFDIQDCHASWFRGWVANRLGQEGERDLAWGVTIRCLPQYILMLRILAPQNQALAELAVQEQPAAAEAWFWLANLRVKQSADEAIELYQRGLDLKPQDGLRWRELGDLWLTTNQPQSALEAYLQSCYHGDPGSNGCYGAGRIVEDMGDFQTAIRYYRLSRWSGAHERAAQLEQQLKLEQGP